MNTEDTITDVLVRGYTSQLIFLCLVPGCDLTHKPGILYILGFHPQVKLFSAIVSSQCLSQCIALLSRKTEDRKF